MASSNNQEHDRLEEVYIGRLTWPMISFPPINLWVIGSAYGYIKDQEEEPRIPTSGVQPVSGE